jgi:hypothetical protein
MIRFLPFSTLLLVLTLAVVSFADDPPARVARLRDMEGSVSFRPGNVDDWAPASRNRPLTTGDYLWTDKDARSELRVGATTIRMGPETAFAFLNLDDHVVQMQVTQGSARIHVRSISEGEALEVDTPNVAVSLLHPGTYRIDVDGNGDSTVSVRHGNAVATADGSEVPVQERQVGTFLGKHPLYDLEDETAPDSWERWCADQERRDEQPRVSAKYVSPEAVGYEDLDAYGRWREVPEYGAVWIPTQVSRSWAPYRAGHWGYVAPWGWTWIDDAPWGFAPFHYGRWAFLAGSWVWVPGTVVARPVYAPALVAFVGGGSWSASLSLGVGGGVAWFPLGPREVFYPSYAVSRTYVQNINVTHVNVTNINVTNINAAPVTYVNQSVAGAVTAVPRATFVSAQPVAAASVAVPVSAVASVRPSDRPMGVEPTAQSVLSHPVVATAAPVPHPSAAIVSTPVVAKLTPPPPAPAFGASAQSPPIGANPLIKPAIPPAGTPHVGLQPARPALPAARAAVAPSASVAPGGSPPARGTINDRPSRAPSHEVPPQPAGTASQPSKNETAGAKTPPARVQQVPSNSGAGSRPTDSTSQPSSQASGGGVSGSGGSHPSPHTPATGSQPSPRPGAPAGSSHPASTAGSSEGSKAGSGGSHSAQNPPAGSQPSPRPGGSAGSSHPAPGHGGSAPEGHHPAPAAHPQPTPTPSPHAHN